MNVRVLLPVPLLIAIAVGLNGAVTGEPSHRPYYIALAVGAIVILSASLVASIVADGRAWNRLRR